ncbi:MAG: hypothetical protein GY750_04405 [Lentisphaerae bacterium]|nr:hypothetical protein [Lentisphaerota bacterium]MCP4100653.1 hypothetical protein [Lentisphaerota bacterium]
MKRMCRLILLITIITPIASFGQAEQINAAKAGLKIFMKHISREAAIMDGFDQSDNLQNAYLGKPFNLYRVDPDKLLNFKSEQSVNSVISKTNLWYFPVLIDKEIRSILVVGKLNGEWSAVALGYKNLASEIGKVRKQWPENKGFDPRIIITYQGAKYLFTVPEVDGYNMTFIDFSHLKKSEYLSFKSSASKEDSERYSYSKLNNVRNIVKDLKPIIASSNSGKDSPEI